MKSGARKFLTSKKRIVILDLNFLVVFSLTIRQSYRATPNVACQDSYRSVHIMVVSENNSNSRKRENYFLILTLHKSRFAISTPNCFHVSNWTMFLLFNYLNFLLNLVGSQKSILDSLLIYNLGTLWVTYEFSRYWKWRNLNATLGSHEESQHILGKNM